MIAGVGVILLKGVEILAEIWVLGLRWDLCFFRAGRRPRAGRGGLRDDTVNEGTWAHGLVICLLARGGENLTQWLSSC